MLGTSLRTPGGMTSVVRTLQNAGLFSTFDAKYLATYEGAGLARQLRTVFVALLQLLRALFARQVSLVHAHSASRGSFWRKSVLCAVADLFGVAYVFHVHSGEFPDFYDVECGAVAKWWVRRTLRKAAAVICLTDSWHTRFAAIEPAARLVVIGNPVDVPPKLSTLRAQPINVLFLGRLRAKKGVFDLVAAMPEALKYCPQLRFILAGDEGEEKVRAAASAMGVAHAIELPGWIDGAEKAALLAKADIFVLPSYFEGLPVGLLEAMALGIPVVTTPVGGIPDLVKDGSTGLLIQPGDSGALATALIQLASDSVLRTTLREAAFDHVSATYSLPVVFSQFGELYKRHGCFDPNRERATPQQGY